MTPNWSKSLSALMQLFNDTVKLSTKSNENRTSKIQLDEQRNDNIKVENEQIFAQEQMRKTIYLARNKTLRSMLVVKTTQAEIHNS